MCLYNLNKQLIIWVCYRKGCVVGCFCLISQSSNSKNSIGNNTSNHYKGKIKFQGFSIAHQGKSSNIDKKASKAFFQLSLQPYVMYIVNINTIIQITIQAVIHVHNVHVSCMFFYNYVKHIFKNEDSQMMYVLT